MNEVDLGARLQKARQTAGLTQQELCNKTGLSYSTLAKIERGAIKSPSVFTIQQIAGVLGLTLDELVGAPVANIQKTAKKTSKNGVSFIFFDINGCLVRFFHRAFTRIAEESGKQPDLVETTFWHYNDAVCRGEMSIEEFNAILGEQFGLPTFDWCVYYLDSLDPIDEMRELVAWAAEHYRVGLLSNIMPGLIKEMMDRSILPPADYEVIIDSSEVKAIKPEDAIYEIAEQKSGCQPEQILFVDDSRANLIAAEKRGWKVLWFDDYRPTESVQRVRAALEE